MEVFIGTAAGAAVAALCAFFYRKGIKDGMGFKKSIPPAQGGEEEQSELMRKYELIMSYDPYGASEKAGAWGERV